MIAVVQRVTRAEVRIAGRAPARIDRGLLILVGVARDDREADARWLAQKCLSLRIFNDAAGRMNLGLEDVGGGILAISQFTLLGDCVKGRRPSWSHAAEPAEAERLYDIFVEHLRRSPFPVETGVFQAKMEIESVNDGPVTLIIDSCEWKGRTGGAKDSAAPSEAGSPAAEIAASGLGERLLRGASSRELNEADPIFLASRSPRRAQLLSLIGLRFTVAVPEEDGGQWQAGDDPGEYARRQAESKALSVAHGVARGVTIGADTVVFIDGEVLEKPRDRDEAAAHLRRLSGREHEVFTGLCLARASGDPRVSAVERSRVHMVALDEQTIATYIATGEPLDKAGAYGIQGFGGMLVDRIEGDYFNVMGLPLARLRALFGELEGASA